MAKTPELLAPAGNIGCLKAAVAAGCDAVYFGGSAFNARQGAENFTNEEIREAIAFCRIRGVKTYLTLNTAVKQQEWPSLRAYLKETAALGFTGVIVQDLGAAALIRAVLPELELHASTQMTVHDAAGVRFLQELGFSRVVLARELSLEEIRRIRQETTAELEVFIHGALCCSYSGRCLLSSFHGGWSGNRGTCAQPCRLPYWVDGQPCYPMNLKDLCAAPCLQELLEEGVDSLKIEGRMKGIPYVAGITEIYRELLDGWKTEGRVPELNEEKKRQMQQLFSRGDFTDGYLRGDKRTMLARRSPKHQGVPVGRVQKVEGGRVTVELTADTAPGDVLEIHAGKPPYPSVRLAGGMLQGRTACFRTEQRVRPGDTVYRLVDTVLNEALRKKTETNLPVPIRIEAKLCPGAPLELTGTCRDTTVRVCGRPVQAAEKRALTAEEVKRQLGRLGETDFAAETVTIDMEGACFVPVSELNGLRRELVRTLEESLTARPQIRPEACDERAVSGNDGILQIGVKTRAQWKAVLNSPLKPAVLFPGLGLADRALTEETRRKGIAIVPSCPPISRMKQEEALERNWQSWSELGIDGFEAQHLGQVQLLQERGSRVWAGFGLAVMNRPAAAFWQERSEGFLLSAELTGEELKALAGLRGAAVLVYGRIPLMITEQCFFSGQQGCRPDREGHRLELKDRCGASLTAESCCDGCYTILYEGTPLWLGDRLGEGFRRRIEFTDEGPETVARVLEALWTRSPLGPEDRGWTAGHWDKGVL